MSFRVRIEIEEVDDKDDEVLSLTEVTRHIKEDSYNENSDEWASIMDSAVCLVYGRRVEFSVKSVWNGE